ncbi:hypothetical protein BaRGS_00007193 [Batillaria attramentaria]|uniref:Uncharacterized protein n=1 Tax=Batillaria attramentaria TaxID=370345 RepID=A0ABD0LRW1_9CAEN
MHSQLNRNRKDRVCLPAPVCNQHCMLSSVTSVINDETQSSATLDEFPGHLSISAHKHLLLSAASRWESPSALTGHDRCSSRCPGNRVSSVWLTIWSSAGLRWTTVQYPAACVDFAHGVSGH